jgi:hypothetical protein
MMGVGNGRQGWEKAREEKINLKQEQLEPSKRARGLV